LRGIEVDSIILTSSIKFPGNDRIVLQIPVKAQLPAIVCALTLPLCAILIHPVAETGICDDWSYIKTTQILAESGHIVYNGWSTAMLGWQLYLGALFVKLFGFTFTVVRSSNVLVSMATAFLVQRTFVRAGIREWNATLATMTFILSPLFLPLAFSFMTDVSGIFCTVLCLYMCLRALQAETSASTIAWISFAALLNAIGGTARQTIWLGVLIMVPSTLWLLRRKPRVLLIGGLSYVTGIGILFALLHWFDQQPYAVPEGLVQNRFGFNSVVEVLVCALRGGAELLLLLLPVLLMFVSLVLKCNRRMATAFAAGIFIFALLGLILFLHHRMDHWLAPFFGPYVSVHGLVDDYAILGTRPVLLHDAPRLLLTVLTIIGFASLLAAFPGNLPRLPSTPSRFASITWRDLSVILVPYSVAYLILLVPRASSGGFFDRYLLPLMPVSLLVLVRYYQERVRSNLPIACVILIGIFACFGVAATHDLFAMYRGYLAAFEEIRSSGVPATAIKGSWENDGWTEIEKVGYINQSRMRIPRDAYVYQPVIVYPASCDGYFLDRTPAIKPMYALSFDPGKCDGHAGFPPVIYSAWLGPRFTSIYIVKYPAIPGR
jgi:hypothetical protein